MTYTAVSSFGRREDREQFLHDLLAAIAPLELVRLEAASRVGRDISLELAHPLLKCLVHIEPGTRDDVPLLHWHSAKGRLAPVSGAWESVNPHHRHKATSFPMSHDQALQKLVLGFQAVISGEAFEGD